MTPMMHHSTHWGGARPGAGRPTHNAPSRSISIHVPEELIQILDRQADQRRISRSAMITHYLREGIGENPSQPKPTQRTTNPTKEGKAKS